MEGILNPECPFSGSILKFTSIVKIKVVYFWFWFWFWFVVVVVDVCFLFMLSIRCLSVPLVRKAHDPSLSWKCFTR